MVKYEREKFVDFVRRLREKWGVYSPDRRIVRNVRVWNCKEAGRKKPQKSGGESAEENDEQVKE